MLLTAGKISKEWGVAKSYVQRCIKRGCPTDTFENSRAWRLANTTKRATTSPRQIAKLLAEERDSDAPEARAGQKKYSSKKPDRYRLPSGDSLKDALHNAIEASEEAFRLLKEAMIEEKDQKISARLAVFNKSSENRFKAEQAYREEKERRSILIELSKAQEWTRKVLDVILSGLARMPQNLAARLNPQDPHIAMTLLEEEVQGLTENARKAITIAV